MEIQVKDRKLGQAIDDFRVAQRVYGKEMATKLKLRIAALAAAANLADFWPPKTGPERCHELHANLAGFFSVDLKHPQRLIFVPINAPTKAQEPDEFTRWSKITQIEILGIEDTHD